MRKIIFILFLIFPYLIFSQENYEIKFHKLNIIDTIQSRKTAVEYMLKSHTRKGMYFIYYGKYNSLTSNFLFKKENNSWIVMPIPGKRFSEPILSDNRNYLLLSENDTHGARQIVSANTELFIINLKENSILSIPMNEYLDTWEYDNHGNSITQQNNCSTKVFLHDNILTALSFKSSNFSGPINCQSFMSGIYKIGKKSLRKIKYYSEDEFRMKHIIWVNDFCIGMSIELFKEKYPQAKFKEIPLYTYGFNSEKNGFEISFNNRPYYFFSVRENKITNITVITKNVDFDGINTQSKVSYVLNKYPNSRLHVDLISLFEYIYIAELKIRLVFKTNESNSIGKYETEVENGTRNIIRPNATPDFIVVK